MEAPTALASNIAPHPNFVSSGRCSGSPGAYRCTNPCVTANLSWPIFSTDPSCTAYALEAINNARSKESVVPMVLPTNWGRLTIPRQMLVITNLERIARGYPPYLGLNARLNATAVTAALHRADPPLARGFVVGYDALGSAAYGGTWSSGWSVLIADYGMMYFDGWNGSRGTWNVVCTSPSARGCWAHRNEILGNAPNFNPGVGLWCDTCEMGAGYAVVAKNSSYSQLMEMSEGTPPPVVFAWKSELPYFPRGAIGTVKSVSLARVALNRSTLRVQWVVTGVQNASLAALYTFTGSRCARVGRVASFRYVPAFNIRRNTLTMSGAGQFFPQNQYSAVVRVFTPQGSLTSRCLPLGHN